MNTRRYPRSFAEAFPSTPEYACALERPAPRSGRLWLVLAALAAITLLAVR
jgi:hypothetical protein